ncbi:cobalt transporter subunit CbtA [Pseudorhizobium tarimense]|uniref:Cobalt transporter subunit CbtA n=1 Tax=Pseudorhizobium tarimense TaxID=1079109 RepID=A0ABV2H4S0_9HYPH|nr:CbtA family protein [Pseudorhizobium tarimense]MCJ8518777.1 CbtA family protein [Pseudorhizobium tarimense]
MFLFRNIVFTAVIAGFVSGLCLTLLQSFATVPLIIQAETFESGETTSSHSHDHAHDAATPAHEHGEDSWMPADGAERLLYTAAANMLAGIGFALILLTASEALGGFSGWRSGLMFGLAGFLAFSLAPGLGLPPELPGMPAAELGARQLWWMVTAVCTAAALGLFAFSQTPALAGLGVLLLVLPHLSGAPLPANHETAVPAELHARFVAAVFATSLIFWALLGTLCGAIRVRLRGGEEAYPSNAAESVR